MSAFVARQLIEKYQITSPRGIDLSKIARDSRISIEEEHLDGCDGMLQMMIDPKCGIITVRESIRESGQKRFVIAHELGHYLAPAAHSQDYKCGSADLNPNNKRVRPQERAANEFAAELLMPSELFVPLIQQEQPSLTLIKKLSDAFRTTLTATLWRFIEFTNDRCALVISENGRIKYGKPSKNFKFRIPSDIPLSEYSYASCYFKGEQINTKGRDVPANAWITDSKLDNQCCIREHSIAQPKYNSVLTLLWMDGKEDISRKSAPRNLKENSMNIFQLIKTVLDELYARIPGDEATKDKAIKVQIDSLQRGYKILTKGVTNNYSDATTRFAYLYKYVTSHANIVFQLIGNSPDLASLFEKEKIQVTCVGGGPGSDFLGILKHVIRERKQPHLRCTLFDKEEAWGECWNDVDDKLESDLRISTFFQAVDVKNDATWRNYEKFLTSDLFTMIYFMSEVSSLRTAAEAFFVNLFENAKKGAIILFVDNNNEEFYGWFDSLVKKYNWRVLKDGRTKMKMDDFSEEKKDLGEYYNKFADPKLTANIAFRICQKL